MQLIKIVFLFFMLMGSLSSFAYYNSSINVISGGNLGNTITNTDYEYVTSLVQTGSDTLLMFNRTGSDATYPLPGQVTVNTYTISTNTFSGATGTVIYDPGPTWFVQMAFARVVGTHIYLYLSEGQTANVHTNRIGVIVSTDLTGSSWGSETILRSTVNSNPPEFGGYVTTSDPNVNYLVLVNDTAGQEINLQTLSSDGLSMTQGPTVLTNGNNEGWFYYIGNHKIIGILRDDNANAGAGTYLLEVTSADDGQTWTAPFSTGLGFQTGAKVTPKLIAAPGHPDRVFYVFYDRGTNRLTIGGPTIGINAYNNNWIPSTFLGTAASQGNGDAIGFDPINHLYFVNTLTESGAGPIVTKVNWWVVKDIYNNTKF